MRTPAAGGIPRGVWALGFVSLFMDMSSELIHSLLPVFMVSVLGASVVSVGLIEGTAEAAASITKVFSGALSDRLGKRKALAVAGYGLAALTKPIFAVAPALGWVFAARFADRIGKGIRGAPRDALIADIVPAGQRGASYGLRQSLDTLGAVAGPLLAIGLMAAFADDIRTVFGLAVIPAALAVVILLAGVREPARTAPAERPARAPLRLADARRLSAAFWWVAGIGGVMTLARFSEAFLVLRAQDAGLSLRLIPLVLIVMSIVYAASAYPAGWLADRMDPRRLLALGLAALIAADVVLALAAGPAGVLVGVAVWGLHMGLTQGILTALVADSAPADLRGTAFGLFGLLAGVIQLAASALAGALWVAFGAPMTFFVGAGLAGAALAGVLIARLRGPASATRTK